MILQELHRYYGRLLADPECDVPPAHWSTEKVAWEITLAEDGRVVRVLPLTTGEGKELRRFIPMRVPEHGSRSGTGILPFFLCDNAAYLLGLDSKRGEEKRAGARALHEDVLASCDDAGAQAVRAFFERDDCLEGLDETLRAELASGGFMVFRLSGDRQRVHEREAVRDAWAAYCDLPSDDDVVGQCAITGERTSMARLFPQVTGVPGAQSAGASLVSFNLDSFESYGKKQAYNASLSQEVAFNAGSALRYLYGDLKHRVRFGQTTVVFWTDRTATDEELMMLAMLGDEVDPRVEDTADLERIQQTLECMKEGNPLEGYDLETRFFILGLAPNAARLAVRFFETNTFGAITRHYGEYLRDIEMDAVKPRSLRSMLRQTAPLGEADAVPSTLVNNCLHAMLTGSRFPRALPQLVIARMRADHGDNNPWDTGQRAALLKACLVRDQRIAAKETGERVSSERSLQVDLNEENTDRGYVLGRLFAVLERTQTAALGDVNATIKDRFIGAASMAPSRVYPSLLRNHQHHMAKLRKSNAGLSIKLEKEMDGIMPLLGESCFFPAMLDLTEQGNFYVGYYQERQFLWRGKKSEASSSDAASTETSGE